MGWQSRTPMRDAMTDAVVTIAVGITLFALLMPWVVAFAVNVYGQYVEWVWDLLGVP